MNKLFILFAAFVLFTCSLKAQNTLAEEAREMRRKNANGNFPRWEINEAKVYKLKGFTDTTQLNFTKKSNCEFDCLQLTDALLRDIILYGTVNLDKSVLDKKPAPVYAVEATADGGEKFRVITSPEGEALKIISVYRLDKKITCDCKE